MKKVVRFPRSNSIPDRVSEFWEIPSLDLYPDASEAWTVEGLFPKASLILLAAPPAGYKTWFALALAKAVSQGSSFLGRATVRTPVLYLDRENPLSLVRQRKAILGLDDQALLKIWGDWIKDPPALIGDSRLGKFAASLSPLIILDSFLRFHSSDENSARDMAVVMKRLKDLTSVGATVLLLHHPGKGNAEYRGSTDILAGVDAAFKIVKKKTKQETILTLSCFKHRFVDESDLTCTFVLRDGSLHIIGKGATDGSSELIDKIKEAISDNPGVNQNKLIASTGLPETNGRKLLQEGDGIHWMSKHGRRKSLLYFPKP